MENLNEEIFKTFNLPAQFLNPDALANTYYNYERLESIAEWLKTKTSTKPLVAIICGSGLGRLAEIVENTTIIPYSQIPDFPRSTVHGHKGNLVFGNLGDFPVVCMQGRFHPYEGYCSALCTMPIKVFKLLGVKLLIITNAAGGLNPDYKLGDIMLIKDHLSFAQLSLNHPLIGPNDERFGPRFPPLYRIYCKELRQLLLECSKELNIKVHEGIYGNMSGPTYESPSDSRWCRLAGMDTVGMSSSHEAIVASYCGMKVLGLSIVTDLMSCDYDLYKDPNHEEIVQVANARAKDTEELVVSFLKKLNLDLIN